MIEVATALGCLLIPGAVIARLLRIRHADPLAAIGHHAALGVAFWPLLFLLSTLAGFVWTSLGVRMVLAVFAAVLVWMILRERRRARTISLVPWLFVALVVGTRILHVREVVWPLWVDSVHHTMIVRLLLDRGTLPSSYEPFIDGSTFYYHWGFHAIIAVIAWISGTTAAMELPELVLGMGQLLNVLMFFAVYAGAKALLLSRRAALLAAVLATLVSWFPAYYVSWGRYTQLAGLLILPPLAAQLWWLMHRPSAKRLIVVALLASGLILVHIRVTLVFAAVAAILGLLAVLQRRWRGLLFAAAAAVIASAVAMPWLLHVAQSAPVQSVLAPRAVEWGRWETRNLLPPDLVWAPNNIPLFILATGGLVALLPLPAFTIGWRIVAMAFFALLLFSYHRKPWPLARFAILAAWVAVIAVVTNLEAFGLPRLRLLPNSAAFLMLFLPMSIAAAMVVTWMIDAHVPVQRRYVVLLAMTAIAAIAGTWMMRRIVNPATILVTPADEAALQWIHDAAPPESKFAVGIQPWIGGAFVGVDGGYWIPVAASRQSILPPGLYPWVISTKEADRIGTTLKRWHEAEIAGDVSVIDLLRREGVTHLYFGAKNRYPLRNIIGAAPEFVRVYERDGVSIYEMPRERSSRSS